MSIVTKDGETVFRTLAITPATLEKWIEDNLNSKTNTNEGGDDREALPGLMEDDEPDEGPLRELDILIQPLGEFSNRDDLLVFCPSGPLHSLPLHALRLDPSGDGEILITRNPIVYCASLTSFSQCSRHAGSAVSSSNASATKSFLAVYEPSSVLDQTIDFDQAEQQQVYSSIDTIATRLQGKVFYGANVTHEVLRESLEESQFVHFHGHCDLDTELITEQSLRLSNQAGSAGQFSVYSVPKKNSYLLI
jgi:CHAT domain-containing protein